MARLPAGPPRLYRPPTPVLRADPSRPALFRFDPAPALPNALFAVQAGLRPGSFGTSAALVLKATERLSPVPLRHGGAVTQTLSGERPAGLRTTRAEQSEARTTLPLPSRTSTRI